MIFFWLFFWFLLFYRMKVLCDFRLRKCFKFDAPFFMNLLFGFFIPVISVSFLRFDYCFCDWIREKRMLFICCERVFLEFFFKAFFCDFRIFFYVVFWLSFGCFFCIKKRLKKECFLKRKIDGFHLGKSSFFWVVFEICF